MILHLDSTVPLMVANGTVKTHIPVDYMMMKTSKLTGTAVLVEVVLIVELTLVLMQYAKTLLELIHLVIIAHITLPILTHVVIMIMISLRLLSIVVLADILSFLLSNL